MSLFRYGFVSVVSSSILCRFFVDSSSVRLGYVFVGSQCAGAVVRLRCSSRRCLVGTRHLLGASPLACRSVSSIPLVRAGEWLPLPLRSVFGGGLSQSRRYLVTGMESGFRCLVGPSSMAPRTLSSKARCPLVGVSSVSPSVRRRGLSRRRLVGVSSVARRSLVSVARIGA